MSEILPRVKDLIPERVKAAAPAQLKDAVFWGLARMGMRWRLIRRRRSRFVSDYLEGLNGIEIGAASHNPFYLNAINVDRYASDETIYKDAERRLVGKTARVDVVAHGDDLPFADHSYDFVFSSHVIEHFPDPIRALQEWVRVARRYVVAVVPHRDRTFDSERELTSIDELMRRHRERFSSDEDSHWSVWTCESFIDMCRAAGLRVLDHQDPDDKNGIGFTIVIDASPSVAATPTPGRTDPSARRAPLERSPTPGPGR